MRRRTANGILLTLALAAACATARASEATPEQWARRCQAQPPTRYIWPQGTLLWGTQPLRPDDPNSSVLSAVSAGAVEHGLYRLQGGRIVAGSGSGSAVGAVLRGESSDGTAVDVAICGEEPVAGEPDMAWYRVQIWSPVSQEWENPCAGSRSVPDPRALAVGGTWDRTGAHHDAPSALTFACETGAIAKCVRWGYKPWETVGGEPVAPLHQACTRMARADYCGDGQSHTRDGTLIDIYDASHLLARTVRPTTIWQPDRASFEAAWGPDGAVCLARARDDRPLGAIQRECPGRFSSGALDLGDGDRCSLRREGASPGGALLRNRSYPAARGEGG